VTGAGRPRTYTQEQAAARLGVARRTIRDWCRRKDRQGRPWLTPIPGTRASLGYPLYDEPSLVAAERLARAGRTRRRRALAP
jgi:transcriptional regulator with XRE-family HTH domain